MTISRGPAIDGRMLDAANKGADGDDDSVLDLDAQAIVRQESAMDEQPGNNGAGWAALASHFRSGGVPEVDHEVGEASMIQVDVDNLFPELGSEDSEEIGAGAAAATPPLATDVAPPAAPGVAAAPEAQQPAVDVAETGDDAVRGVPREPDASAQPRQQRTGPATRWSLIYRHVFMGCTLDRVKETGRPIQTAPALWQKDMAVIADATLTAALEFETQYGKDHFGRNNLSSNPTVADSLKLGMAHDFHFPCPRASCTVARSPKISLSPKLSLGELPLPPDSSPVACTQRQQPFRTSPTCIRPLQLIYPSASI